MQLRLCRLDRVRAPVSGAHGHGPGFRDIHPGNARHEGPETAERRLGQRLFRVGNNSKERQAGGLKDFVQPVLDSFLIAPRRLQFRSQYLYPQLTRRAASGASRLTVSVFFAEHSHGRFTPTRWTQRW